MEQPVPKISETDLGRLLRRDFSSDSVSAAREVLEQYGSEIWHREALRVRAASLKLACGDLERLRIEIDRAKVDFRDVLASAEYPEYSKSSTIKSVSHDEERKIIDADWKQYQEWLLR